MQREDFCCLKLYFLVSILYLMALEDIKIHTPKLKTKGKF